MMVSVLIADRDPVERRGLRSLLAAEANFSVVGEADDGQKTISLVEHLHPDVLVVDTAMPGTDGLHIIEVLRSVSAQTRIVILSSYGDQAFAQEALERGACACVTKRATEENLVQAVRDAAAGKPFCAPPLVTNGGPTGEQHLTAREREVLQMAAKGETSAQIAHRLQLSERTVEHHRARGMRKLGLKNVSALVRYALRRGLICLED